VERMKNRAIVLAMSCIVAVTFGCTQGAIVRWTVNVSAEQLASLGEGDSFEALFIPLGYSLRAIVAEASPGEPKQFVFRNDVNGDISVAINVRDVPPMTVVLTEWWVDEFTVAGRREAERIGGCLAKEFGAAQVKPNKAIPVRVELCD